VMPRGGGSKLPASTVRELVDQIKETGFRLGVEAGAAYPSPDIEKFLADPANRQQIVDLREQEQLPALLNGRIDGFLAERVVAAFNIEELKVENEVEEHPVKVDGKIHLMFSKASVPPEVVADFNRAIEQVQQDRTYRQLNEKYTFPIIVRLTLASDWFFIVDILGTMAFALSGLLLAFRFNYDIFGALVLASLPAVGGGVVRDLITNRGTLAVLSSPIYIEVVLFLVVGGFVVIRIGMAIRKSRLGSVAAGLLERRRRHIETSIQVFDAIGLAAFTVTGVVVAVATQSRPLWLWGPILAAITAAGGGILRDVVRSEPEISVLKGELYPEIALVWGLFLSLFMIWQSWHLNSHEIAVGVAITFFGAFLTRIATIYFGFRSFRFSA
ncbi:MAG: TRIC cation channel family protein, partial [Pseudomonadota bacterium]